MSPSSWDTIFGLSSLICFFLGTTGNILAVTYFLTRPKTLSPNTLLYICINITDIVICCLSLITGLVNLSPSLGETLFHSAPFFCNLWGILWNVTIRVSVFLIALLSITRVVSLHRPYTPLALRSAGVPVVVYLVLMLFQAAIPFMRGATYQYFPRFKVCSWDLGKVFKLGSVPFNVLYFLLNIVEFVVPIFPVTSCCCFIIMKLRSRSVTATSARTTLIKREATVTIVLLTVTYLIWNLPLCIVLILNYTTQVNELRHHGSPRHYHFTYDVHLRTFMNSQTIVLNSVCNTCLYFYRITELRRWTVDLIDLCLSRVFGIHRGVRGWCFKPPVEDRYGSRSRIQPKHDLDTVL